MAWTEITRLKYQRDRLRVASDTTNEEWGLIEPLPPDPCNRGRPRKTDPRRVGLLPRARRLPLAYAAEGIPTSRDGQYYFYRRRDDGTWLGINHALVIVRENCRDARRALRRHHRQPVGEDQGGDRRAWL
jgi:hypothetical protein